MCGDIVHLAVRVWLFSRCCLLYELMHRVILNITKRHHHVVTVFDKEFGVFVVPSFNKQLISCSYTRMLLCDGHCVVVILFCFCRVCCPVKQFGVSLCLCVNCLCSSHYLGVRITLFCIGSLTM